MATSAKTAKAEKTIVSIAKHRTATDNHKKAAEHLEEAPNHYEAGNNEKAALSTVAATGHYVPAGEHQIEDAKRYPVKRLIINQFLEMHLHDNARYMFFGLKTEIDAYKRCIYSIV
jgi:hypothetical protein